MHHAIESNGSDKRRKEGLGALSNIGIAIIEGGYYRRSPTAKIQGRCWFVFPEPICDPVHQGAFLERVRRFQSGVEALNHGIQSLTCRSNGSQGLNSSCTDGSLLIGQNGSDRQDEQATVLLKRFAHPSGNSRDDIQSKSLNGLVCIRHSRFQDLANVT
jgi:hypothetical protein